MGEHDLTAGLSTGTTLLALARESLACRNEEDFAALARGNLKNLLPHRSLVAALGRVDLEHLHILKLVGVDHPPAALSGISHVGNIHSRKALLTWLQTREPLILSLPEDAARLSDLERQEIESHRLGRVAAHGVLDLASREGSYFSFAGLPRELARGQIEQLLRLVVPYLHQALLAVHRTSKGRAERAFTEVELELLRWVAAGRTNGEIAGLRKRSIATVRNQLSVLFRKMGVCNRAEAVRAGVHLIGPGDIG